MKKYITLIFLSSFFLENFAQVTVSGKVIDMETKVPVEFVYIQNLNHPENTTISDTDGAFSIGIDSLDVLNFHRIGYVSGTHLCKDPQAIEIQMKLADYQLQEVTITYEDASKIVEKAISNLRDKYIKGPLIYLWHGIETELINKENKESYALYSADFSKIKSKKSEMFFDFQLSHLNHYIINVQNSKLLMNNTFVSNYFPHIIHINQAKNYRITQTESENDSLIFITCSPKQIKRGDYVPSFDIVINKSDTVLLSFSTLPLDSEAEKAATEQYKKAKFLFFVTIAQYKLWKYIESFSVKKMNEYYYFDSFYSNILMSFLTDDGEELIEIENISNVVPDKQLFEIAPKKKLKRKSNLFNLKTTTNDCFWEDYKVK
jgi:hypothetical protein